MKHNDDGKQAEIKTSQYLESLGFKIIDNNWKTTKCEIDIIAKKKGCVYFVEVKYRSNDSQGTGFDYVTYAKQKQMAYAAESWVVSNNWTGNYCLSAASVYGPNYKIDFIEEIY